MSVLVVAPHPDDESLGCGGAVCAHRTAGEDVAVVFLTSGEAGVDDLAPGRAALLREGEARAAADVLGIGDVRFLGLPDGHVADHLGGAVEALVGLLDELRPSTVYAPHAGDGHEDHAAAHTAVAQALALTGRPAEAWGYEVWTPLSSWERVLPVDDHLPTKLEALACHRSQLERYAFDRAAEGLAAYRGALAGACRYAEVFQRIGPAPGDPDGPPR